MIGQPPADPFTDLARDIREALRARAYWAALAGALSLPSLCASLVDPNNQDSGRAYSDWYDHWVVPRFGGSHPELFTGWDCYNLRNSVLHEGSARRPARPYRRAIFLLDQRIHRISARDGSRDGVAYAYTAFDVGMFCEEILTATQAWLPTVRGTEPFESNSKRLMRLYPSGHPDFPEFNGPLLT